jgi:hypothetical protein
MTLIPLIITTVCYLWVCVTATTQHRPRTDLSLAFLGYAFAQGGFLYICLVGQP